jgi:D-sedoheptulose 7-phosphate isomerase
VRDESFSETFLRETEELAREISRSEVEVLASAIATLRDRGGRLFFLGVGGGAAHASHAAADFRKLCGLEAYSATENVAELTARVNDEGWDSALEDWLRASRLTKEDGIFVFSVGGGSVDPPVSTNLVAALQFAADTGALICGVVGQPGGVTARVADVCILVDAPPERRTFHVEGFQAVVWHLLATHPLLAQRLGRWESLVQEGDTE